MAHWAALCAATLAFTFVSPANGEPGDIDPGFSRDGFAKLGGPGKWAAAGVAIADRGVVVGGTRIRRGRDSVVVARFRPNGKRKRTFADNGLLTTTFGAAEATLSDIQVQPDGKLVVAGSMDADLLVARLGADGMPDRSFADDGVARLDFGGDDAATSLALQADGAIVVAGGSTAGSKHSLVLARLTGAGTVDPSFAGDGSVDTGLPGTGVAQLLALALAPDGAIYAGGVRGSTTLADAFVARYGPGGILDAEFADQGIFRLEKGGSAVTAMARTHDGHLVLAGRESYGAGFIARLMPSGSLDTGVGREGLGDVEGSNYFGGVALDGEGRVITAGGTIDTRYGSPGDMSIGRLSPELVPDRTFGARGARLIDFHQADDGAMDLAPQADEKIVATATSNDAIVVARLEVTPGKPDLDGDNVADRKDRCRERWSKKSNDGCPHYGRRVTFSRRAAVDVWVGRVTSSQQQCAVGEQVKIFRTRRRTDLEVNSARTNSEGRYRADASLEPGRYYASLAPNLGRRLGVCERARSKPVVIH